MKVSPSLADYQKCRTIIICIVCYFLQQTMDEMGDDILEERHRGKHMTFFAVTFYCCYKL